MVQDKLLEKILYELAQLKQENRELKEIIKTQNLEIKELKRRLDMDSSNSSKPPSTNNGFKDPDKKDPSTNPKVKKKKRGGQVGSKGTNLNKVDKPDFIEALSVTTCKNCNHNLEDIESRLISSKQLFDIPKVSIEVTEFQIHSKTCPCCNSINKPQYPSHLKASTQYGDNIKTFIAYLNTYQMLPYDRISELLEDFISHKISSGTIYNMLNSFHTQLEPFESDIKGILLKSDVIHVDETGTRVKDKLHWTHVVSTSLITYYMIHKKRGAEAIDAMAILPNYKGIAVHDHWRPYSKYNCTHSFCNAHLLRELIGIEQNEDVLWATNMHTLLTNMNSYIYKLKENSKISPSRGKLQHFYKVYDNICQSALAYYPPPSNPTNSKRKPKQSKGKNLLDRFVTYKDETLRFFTNLLVPFTNNLAERDLRMIKVKEKISGCFASFKGAEIFNRIRGYISTVKKNNKSVFNELRNVLYGKYYVPELAGC